MTNHAALAREIFYAALAAVDPFKAVQSELEQVRTFFRVGDFTRLLVMGFGKASWRMAAACEHLLGDLISAGIIVTKYGHATRLKPARRESLRTKQPTRCRMKTAWLLPGRSSTLSETPTKGRSYSVSSPEVDLPCSLRRMKASPSETNKS